MHSAQNPHQQLTRFGCVHFPEVTRCFVRTLSTEILTFNEDIEMKVSNFAKNGFVRKINDPSLLELFTHEDKNPSRIYALVSFSTCPMPDSVELMFLVS